MSEMIERVAEAIVAKMTQQTGRPAPRNTALSKVAIALARAAIEAMREPTKRMVAASGRFNHARDEEIWRAMIDAALDPADCVRETSKA